MRTRLLAALAVSLLSLSASLPAQRPRDLTVRDLFVVDYFLVYPREEPRAWIDADRYLVFDSGRVGEDGPQGWSAVEARTGKRSGWLDRGALQTTLAVASGLPEETVAAVLEDADHYVWNADHSACLVSLGKDLYCCARDASTVRLTRSEAEELEPTFSPDGSRVAFVRDHDLYTVTAKGGDQVRLTTGGGASLLHGRLDWVYQEEVYGRGNWRAYWWSPDGSQLALLRIDETAVQPFTLVSDVPARAAVETLPYPKTGEGHPVASLGVVAAAGGDPRWFDLSRYGEQQTLIVRVNWVPGGTAVFFQVQDRVQTWLDMLSGDPTTGAVDLVFHEGSDCWVEPGPEPQWIGDGGDFLWPSERDGFRHLYRYAKNGELQGRLTEGPWEVKEVEAVDAAAGAVFFTADRQDCKGVQLHAVNLDGSGLRAITSGGGTHDIEMAPGNAAFLSTWSSVREPESITVRAVDGTELRAVARPQTQMLRAFGLSEPEFVQVPARDGFVMEGMILKPRGFEAGKRYPVVQHLYAGPHAPKVRDNWGHRDYLWHQMLAQQGYLVFLCDNRSASGKGRRAHKACWRNLGVTELQDLEDAADWLVGQGLADPQRMALWGWSYGGYQTLYNLTHSKKWQTGIAVNAVTDWLLYDTIYTERYHGLPQDNVEAYQRSSVVAAAGDLHGELLLVTAAMDDNVHMQNSLQFLHALQMAQKQCRFMVYPRVRHGIETLEQQMHLFTMMTDFLREKL